MIADVVYICIPIHSSCYDSAFILKNIVAAIKYINRKKFIEVATQ